MRESSVHAIFVPPLDCPKLQTGPKNAKAMLKECTPWLHGGVSLLTLLCFPFLLTVELVSYYFIKPTPIPVYALVMK